MKKITETQAETVKLSQPEELTNLPYLKWSVKLDEKTGKEGLDDLTLSNGTKEPKALLKALKRTTGTTNSDLSMKILQLAASGSSLSSTVARLNDASATLPALHPKDETEALLLGQFIALQDSGMQCLRNANSQDMFYHFERLFSLATKLFNTANQTMLTVLKYRSGGQQTMQVIHVHNEGQAIVAQNLSTNPQPGEQEKKSSIEPHGSL